MAGDGAATFADGVPATSTSLDGPTGLALDRTRTLYITDTRQSRIRKVSGQDSDGDGCPDAKELGANSLQGGSRDPDNQWDFFDTPEPVLTSSDGSGVRSHAVTLSDAIGVLFYVGTVASSPSQQNGNGVIYGSDQNGNGVADGREYDHTLPDQTKPWRSGPPRSHPRTPEDPVPLNQVGANCN